MKEFIVWSIPYIAILFLCWKIHKLQKQLDVVSDIEVPQYGDEQDEIEMLINAFENAEKRDA